MAKKLENLSVGDVVAEKADFDLNQSGQPTADYVSTLFTSANTSNNAENVRTSAADATPIKTYIDTTVGNIETLLSDI